MSLRYVFLPAPSDFASQRLPGPCARGDCLALGHEVLSRHGSWEEFRATLPSGFQPDFVALDLPYAALPPWVLTSPLPLIGLAGDGSLLWHGLRDIASRLDLVLSDVSTVERLQRCGIAHAHPALLYGVEQAFVEPLQEEIKRDIDILFIGNLHPFVQSERLPWLQRLARLGNRWRVVIATNVWGEDYRLLLRRSRIVFNRSVRGEWNRRIGECCGQGSLLFVERSNREAIPLLQDRLDCVFYGEDLEDLLEHYLTHEDERRAIADRARSRAAAFSYEGFWPKVLQTIEQEWEGILQRSRNRLAPDEVEALVGRTWRALTSNVRGTDPTLYGDLLAARSRHPNSAEVHNALGLVVALLAREGRTTGDAALQAAGHFGDACQSNPRHLVATLNLVEALVGGGQEALAIQGAEHLLQALDRGAGDVSALQSPRFPPGFDVFNVQWEKAGWDHAGDGAAEAQTKRELLRWRLHYLLGQLQRDLGHLHEAVLARPDLPLTRATLGCALGALGRSSQAVAHLRAAVIRNPFDAPACQALYQVLVDTGQREEAEQLAEDRLLLRQAAGELVPLQEWFQAPSAPAARFQTLQASEFTARFGNPDTARALCGFTPPHDTHAVLTLLTHCRPRKIVEVGTAEGHMTANFTEWSPEEAVIFTLGITRDLQAASVEAQRDEAPPREVLGRLSPHFGKGAKVCGIVADSLHYDFKKLAPIDFAFIDGAHDKEHVLSDTRKLYEALAPGGCLLWHDWNSPTPWVEVRQAVEEAALPETVFHVEGTEVAFLFKSGQAAPASGQAETQHQAVNVVWEGSFAEEHSFALVNREVCSRLLALGHPLRLLSRTAPEGLGVPQHPLSPALARRLNARLPGPVQVHVRHLWPPDFTPPLEGHWVIVQPWEYGALPVAWLAPLRDLVDEVWVPSKHVRDGFLASGLSPEQVSVIPNGVDTSLFRPEAPPLALKTQKKFKFLFVGGTIWRKGIDALLAAYARAFTLADDVCLVIKDMGTGSFYQGQTAQQKIEELRSIPFAPAVEYLDRSLTPEELAGLYAACDCLVHPYRGEGFGLPIAEAMSCARAVIVTGQGAALDFCTQDNAYLIPARMVEFEQRRLGEVETAIRPYVAEVNLDALIQLLRHVVRHPDEARAKGQKACSYIRQHLTWDHAARAVEQRLQDLARRPIRRQRRSHPVPRTGGGPRRMTTSLSMIVRNEEANIGDCLASVIDLVDEVVINDTGSTDRTKEIAASFGPKVKIIDFPWCDSFAAARNESLRHCTGDFVLWMDADDRLDDLNREKLRTLLENLANENVAYSMKCLCPPDPTTGAPTQVDHLRLFRNDPGMQWEFRVHEQILPSVRRAGGEVRFVDVTFLHLGYQDAALRARKRQRDLRLLHLEQQDNPDHPFTLFNLGSIYQEMGQHEQALHCLQESLRQSDPTDSIVRKLYSLIGFSLNQLGHPREALEVCRQGLRVAPGDPELLLRQARLLKHLGNFPAAEASLCELLSTQPGAHFASTDPEIRSWIARNELALVLRSQGRDTEARAQWLEVVRERPDCLAAWLGLAEVALALKDRASLEEAARQLERFPGGESEAGVLRGRWLLDSGQLEPARQLARFLIDRFPQELGPRQLMADSYLREGTNLEGTEKALRDILLLDPGHRQTHQALAGILRQRLRTENAVFEAVGCVLSWVLGQRYEAACTTPSELQEHLPILWELARECKHVTDLGTGEGRATLAFLWAQPEKLVCVDLVSCPGWGELEPLAGQTQLSFIRGDSLSLDLEETDLLFLDTRHDGPQLRQELSRHAGKVRKYLVLHGTTQFAEQGETPGQPGIWPVIEEFLGKEDFRLVKRHENNGGLAILERACSGVLAVWQEEHNE